MALKKIVFSKAKIDQLIDFKTGDFRNQWLTVIYWNIGVLFTSRRRPRFSLFLSIRLRSPEGHRWNVPICQKYVLLDPTNISFPFRRTDADTLEVPLYSLSQTIVPNYGGPTKTGLIQEIDDIQKSFTRKIYWQNSGDYWERLGTLGLYSLQRRRKRYSVIGSSTPGKSVRRVNKRSSLRHGRVCVCVFRGQRTLYLAKCKDLWK